MTSGRAGCSKRWQLIDHKIPQREPAADLSQPVRGPHEAPEVSWTKIEKKKYVKIQLKAGVVKFIHHKSSHSFSPMWQLIPTSRGREGRCTEANMQNSNPLGRHRAHHGCKHRWKSDSIRSGFRESASLTCRSVRPRSYQESHRLRSALTPKGYRASTTVRKRSQNQHEAGSRCGQWCRCQDCQTAESIASNMRLVI